MQKRYWTAISILVIAAIFSGIYIYRIVNYQPSLNSASLGSVPSPTSNQFIPEAATTSTNMGTPSDMGSPLIDVAHFQVSTSNWPFYSSDAENISFQYPPGWTVKEYNDDPPIDGKFGKEIDVYNIGPQGPEGYSLDTVTIACCQIDLRASDLKNAPSGYTKYSATTKFGNIVTYALDNSNEFSTDVFIGNRMFHIFVRNPGGDTSEANGISLEIAKTLYEK